MFATKTLRRVLPLLLILLVATPASAVDFENKWRIGVHLGGTSPTDRVESSAGNSLLLIDPCLRDLTCEEDELIFDRFFDDPRNDSDVFGNLDVQAAPLGSLSVQYAFRKMFIVEGSIGYQKADIGDVEVSAQFLGAQPLLPDLPYAFDTFRVEAGQMERIPIQLTAMARFRPRANFNPYLGGGLGYSIIGFEPSDQFNQLSLNMDASSGVQQSVGDSLFGTGAITPAGSNVDLTGATIDVQDSFEWHLLGGVEYSVKQKWHLFGELRWVDASKNINIGFNGGQSLGIAVPQLTDFSDNWPIDPVFGPVTISEPNPDSNVIRLGGLLDAGQAFVAPQEDAPVGTTCDQTILDNSVCRLLFLTNDQLAIEQALCAEGDPSCRLPDGFAIDGGNDPGLYYVEGGRVSYDGFSFQFGFRYTF